MGHVARKRFGQHFLTDQGVIGDIVDAIDPRPGQALVEIGPGLGALTAPVLQRCPSMTVVELDRDLAARLRRQPGLSVVEADVLTVDFGALADAAGQPLRVIGNLPYNISTPILFALLPWAHRIADQHFMLQKEVVDRMAATPQTGDYGRLSVMLQWRYQVQALLDVPPQAFDPPPRVDSTVVQMVPRPAPAPVDPGLFQELVQVSFSQRRKLLRHTLGRWLDQQGCTASFDLQRRAEEVPVAEYVNLALAMRASA
ncbi:MAG: ribosomal methyltransferase KsgA/Dim1 family protein [Pseudomonadota bacterium]|jgi:16S rRNA (adenine1518-N6/adenine1519-N6)-dimethyltransferase